MQDTNSLARWTAGQHGCLQTWLDLGVAFEGRWRSEQLSEVIGVLEAFADTYGRPRLRDLIEAAVLSRTGGTRQRLTIVRQPGMPVPAADWHGKTTKIRLSDGLWDPTHMNAYHHWSFLDGPYAHPRAHITTRQVIIAHEISHVLISGKRAEAAAAGHGQQLLERLYAEFVPASQWPHNDANANEHLATEIAVWVMQVSRTRETDTFRATVLEATVSNPLWPDALTHVHPQPMTGR